MDQFPYPERLTQLGFQSLDQSRLITDLISYYKIIHGHSSLTFPNCFSFTHNPSVPRSLSPYFNSTGPKKTFINTFSLVLNCRNSLHRHLNVYCSMSTCNLTYHTELSTGRVDPRVGSGRVGSGRVTICWILADRVGSGQHFGFLSFY